MNWSFYVEYAGLLFNRIPTTVYLACFVLLIILVFVAIKIKGKKIGLDVAVTTLLIEYLFIILCSAVIFRDELAKRTYNLVPFWSYHSFFRGEDDQLMPQIIYNVLMFIPIGLLLASFNKRVLLIERRMFFFIIVFFAGLFISVGIETLQYLLKRGLFEFDDIIHNTLGCMFGFLMYNMYKVIKAR